MYIGEGNGNPLQYSCLENPMDRGAWRATAHGVARVGHDLVTKPPYIYKILSMYVYVCICIYTHKWLHKYTEGMILHMSFFLSFFLHVPFYILLVYTWHNHLPWCFRLFINMTFNACLGFYGCSRIYFLSSLWLDIWFLAKCSLG